MNLLTITLATFRLWIGPDLSRPFRENTAYVRPMMLLHEAEYY
jgi:hypothetical protein